MAEQQAPKHFYPAPPFFYTHFTQSNLTQLSDIRREQSQETRDGDALGSAPLDTTSLPQDLRYLVPPSPPVGGKARAFNTEVGLDIPQQTLADYNIESLVHDTPEIRSNPQPYLISLARSMLTTFLALTGVLSEDPTQYAEKVEDLRVLLHNMHELINQYRPHQARETLILMMEERVERLRGEIRDIGEARVKVEGMFRGMAEVGEEQGVAVTNGLHGDGESTTVREDARREKQRAAWKALQAMESTDGVT
ncbi:Mediator of RNA polymerase II transcription subunit 7 [Oleoguttula sp. CCFEE 5521]